MKTNAFKLCLLIPTHIDTSIDSTVCHFLSMIQASLETVWLRGRCLPPALECVNSYIFGVISRILKKNFHDSYQKNGAEQHSKQSRKPSSQQQDFKESWNAYIMLSWVTGHWIYSSFPCCCTSSPEWYSIDIYIQWTTKLLTPIIKSFVTPKVLIQNERVRWFTVSTLCSAFAQGIARVGYSPSFLLLWTLGIY